MPSSDPGPRAGGGGLPLGRRKRLLFVGVTAAALLVGLEAILQLAYRARVGTFLFQRNMLPMLEPSPTSCWWNKPNLELDHRTSEFAVHVYTNAQGFRSDAARHSTPYEKAPGVLRILFLGPSLTFAWGVEYEEAYPTRIGEALRQRGHAVEVINAGVPGHPTGHQLCWLRAEGFRYQPDAIVAVNYGAVGGISTECPVQLDCPVIRDGLLYTRPPTLFLRAVAFARNLGLVFYGYPLYARLLPAPAAPVRGTGEELYGPEARGDPEADPDRLAERYRRYVEAVRGAVGRELPVLLVHIPHAYVVHSEDLGRWRHLGVRDAAAPRLEAAERVAWLQERGVPIVDATPRLAEGAAAERMYYWLDIHLTAAGNTAVAEVLLPLVESALLSDGMPPHPPGGLAPPR